MVLLLDEDGRNLYTIASHGFGDENVGAEVPIGEGQIGIAAERCEPFRLGGLTPDGEVLTLDPPRVRGQRCATRTPDSDAGIAARPEPSGRAGDGTR